MYATQGEFVAQNPLGGVLRDGDEAERHVGGMVKSIWPTFSPLT